MKTPFPEPLKKATDALAENLLASEPFVIYDRARTELTSDTEAKILLDQLSSAQARLNQLQMQGSITQEEIEQYRALQAKVQENAKFIEFQSAQQAATNYLREINQEISQQLGMDFSALVGRSCG
jgi:cell fate (sporulation/competence/biofilm development) regulator YlbF (YheA/YmcA/DUF963 family)